MVVNRNCPHGSHTGYKYSNRGVLSRGQAAVSCQLRMVRQLSWALPACGRHTGETKAGVAGGAGAPSGGPQYAFGKGVVPYHGQRPLGRRELVGTWMASLRLSKCGPTSLSQLGQ